jgi:hypothetical protein
MSRPSVRTSGPPTALELGRPTVTIDDLVTPNRTTLRFSPAGLLTEAEMRPESSLRYLDEMLAAATLSALVPQEVAGPFERVKAVHRYGLFNYGFFTIASIQASFLGELALGVRFVEAYAVGLPLVDRSGQERAVLMPSTFRDVAMAMGSRGSHPHRARAGRKSWILDGHPTFDASFNSLLKWAYSTGRLSGWLGDQWRRNEDRIKYGAITRVRDDFAVPEGWNGMTEVEQAAWWRAFRVGWESRQLDTVRELRNLAAHPTYHQIVTPVDSGRAIIDVAAMINSMWGGDGQSR